MTDFEKGVKEVLAQNSRYEFDEIKLSDPIDKYLSSFMADRLARTLGRKFINANTTELTNELFTTIKDVSGLAKKIASYYH